MRRERMRQANHAISGLLRELTAVETKTGDFWSSRGGAGARDTGRREMRIRICNGRVYCLRVTIVST